MAVNVLKNPLNYNDALVKTYMKRKLNSFLMDIQNIF